MNDARRKDLAKIAAALNDLKSELDGILCDEEESRDNLPENMEEKIEAADQSVSTIEEAISGVDDAVSALEQIE